MKLKSAVRYFMKDFTKPTIIFYGVLMALFLVQLLIVTLVHETGSTGGTGQAATIFLFVVGLNAFKSQFRLFLQNGLSRKTLYTGFVIGIILLSAILTVIDLAFGWFQGLFLRYVSTYMDRFGRLYANKSSFAAIADSLLWTFLSYLSAGMLGFFLSSLYYRMNKTLKLIVSIGVPALFVIIIPLIDSLYTNGTITAFLLNIVAYAFGYGITLDASNGLFAGVMRQFFDMENGVPLFPYRAILFSVLSAAVTASFSFLLVRRATIKE